VTVWTNPGEVTDDAWVQVNYDISELVDGHAAVTIGWVMGPTDGFDPYCGWNIDDIELLGFGASQPPPPTEGSPVLLPTSPNPFGPGRETVDLCFVLPREAQVRLDIYDLRGRHVVTVTDQVYPPGESCVAWDGRDDSGRRVTGGAYVCRLDSGAVTASRLLTAIP
jgi:hypothetical protein